jgi:hypothetical protein
MAPALVNRLSGRPVVDSRLMALNASPLGSPPHSNQHLVRSGVGQGQGQADRCRIGGRQLRDLVGHQHAGAVPRLGRGHRIPVRPQDARAAYPRHAALVATLVSHHYVDPPGGCGSLGLDHLRRALAPGQRNRGQLTGTARISVPASAA